MLKLWKFHAEIGYIPRIMRIYRSSRRRFSAPKVHFTERDAMERLLNYEISERFGKEEDNVRETRRKGKWNWLRRNTRSTKGNCTKAAEDGDKKSSATTFRTTVVHSDVSISTGFFLYAHLRGTSASLYHGGLFASLRKRQIAGIMKAV